VRAGHQAGLQRAAAVQGPGRPADKGEEANRTPRAVSGGDVVMCKQAAVMFLFFSRPDRVGGVQAVA